jgi:SNF2 family DNA or RNA helicase
MLNLIENPLKENGWSFARLDGSMTLQKRRQQLEAFKTQSKVRLLLMSLKAGGLGLNLTEANYVFMLDPWWNRTDFIFFIDFLSRFFFILLGITNSYFQSMCLCVFV